MDNFYKINLDKKIILITGGYGYLGKAISYSLQGHGGRVYVLGKDVKKFDMEFQNTENIVFQYCDISQTQSIIEAFSCIYKKEGRIDVLINNACYLGKNPNKFLSDNDWEEGVRGTLSSTYTCMREIFPYFREQKGGKIINVSSMYGVVAPDFSVYEQAVEYTNPPHYEAAKAGVIQLSRYYASYYGKLGILVNTVTPGPFPSQAVQKNVAFIEELRKKTCLGRVGDPKDIAGVFIFLSSDAANFITGQNFVVDGGWTAK